MDQFLLIGIIVLTFLAFALDWLPIDAVALTSLGLLLVFNLVTPQEAIAGFSNPAVLTVMMMFILSYGLTRTGLIAQFSRKVAQFAGSRHRRGSLALLVTSGVLSAFISNTASVAIFMPVSMQLAKRLTFSPSKILLPLSYISIIGGSCTLIGTSTNLLVGSIAEEKGLSPFGVFEFALLGSLLFVIGLTYIVLGPLKLLPSRTIISSLTRKYHMSTYLTELHVTARSRLVGRTVLEEQLSERFDLHVLEVLRGTQKISVDLRNTKLQAGDELIVRGGVEVTLLDKVGVDLDRFADSTGKMNEIFELAPM